MLRKFAIGFVLALALGAGIGPAQGPRAQGLVPQPEVQALLLKAQEKLNAGLIDEAFQVIAEALKRAQEIKDVAGQAKCLVGMGKVRRLHGRLPETRQYWEQALPHFRSLGPSAAEDEASMLQDLGEVCTRLGDPRAAIPHLQRSLALYETAGNKKGQAGSHFCLFWAHLVLGERKNALPHMEQACSLFREVGDKANLAGALYAMGDAYANVDAKRSEKCLEESLALSRALGRKDTEAASLMTLGTVFRKLGDSAKSLDYFLQSLNQFRLIEDRHGEAAVSERMGQILYEMSKFEDARMHFTRFLELSRELGSKTGEASALLFLGITLNVLGEPYEALRYIEQGKAVAVAIDSSAMIARSLLCEARVYRVLGELDRALDLCLRASTLHRLGGDELEMARADTQAGQLLIPLGRDAEAAEVLHRALGVFQVANDLQGQSSALAELEALMYAVRQDDQAIRYGRSALELDRRLGNRLNEANRLVDIGDSLARMGRPQQALQSLDKARSHYHSIGQRLGESQALQGMSEILLASGELERAARLLTEARSLLEPNGPAVDRANADRGLGRVAEAKGRWEEARTQFLAAAKRYKDWDLGMHASCTLGELAALHHRLGQVSEAERVAREAVRLVEEYRLGTERTAGSGLATEESPLCAHFRLVTLLAQRGDVEGAFVATQKTKARALLAFQGGAQTGLAGAMRPKEAEVERTLRGKASSSAARFTRASEGSGSDQGEAAEKLRSDAKEAELRLQWFYDDFYARHPELRHKRAAKPASVSEVGALVPDDTAVLEYFHMVDPHGRENASKTFLFVVKAWKGQAKVTMHPIPISHDVLNKAVADLRESCAERWGPWRTRASGLYKTLLSPVARELAGKKRLIVCPDGPLWDLPFQVLVDERGKTLTERFEVDYAYSASAAGAVLTAKRDLDGATPKVGPLVVANPDFGVTTVAPADRRTRAVEVVVPRGSKLVALPGAKREADAILRLFPGASVLTGAAAQESWVKKQAGSYRYLHFATHAFVNDAAPMLSSVALARPAKGSEEDGFLTAMEISNMNLPADLVVLSACNTAGGEIRKGEGMVGLSWALHVAGARSQVLTKWAVDDASTATLMSSFYGRMKKGQAKGQALREASLAVMRDGRHGHPYFWAPFVLMGDWR